MNKVMLIGRLGKDPETKDVNGNTVTTWSMATTEKWKDKTGTWQNKTEWHNCQAWGATATAVGTWTTKGTQVFVEGKLNTTKWTDKNGVERWTTNIVVSNVQFLSDTKKKETETTKPEWQAKVENTFPGAQTEFASQDIPF